jgi:hypothetical protein
MVADLLAGNITAAELEKARPQYVRRHRAAFDNRFRDVSLDQRLPETENLRLVDILSSERGLGRVSWAEVKAPCKEVISLKPGKRLISIVVVPSSVNRGQSHYRLNWGGDAKSRLVDLISLPVAFVRGSTSIAVRSAIFDNGE